MEREPASTVTCTEAYMPLWAGNVDSSMTDTPCILLNSIHQPCPLNLVIATQVLGGVVLPGSSLEWLPALERLVCLDV